MLTPLELEQLRRDSARIYSEIEAERKMPPSSEPKQTPLPPFEPSTDEEKQEAFALLGRLIGVQEARRQLAEDLEQALEQANLGSPSKG